MLGAWLRNNERMPTKTGPGVGSETYAGRTGCLNISKISGSIMKVQNKTSRGKMAWPHRYHARTDVRKCSFAVRVVEKWNRLPETVRTAAGKEAFKPDLRHIRK
jgi:hypothetical protein